MTTWMVGNINLTEEAKAAQYHLTTLTDNLRAKGVDFRDANAFAQFVLNEYCVENDGITDMDSADYLSDEQWKRLSIAS